MKKILDLASDFNINVIDTARSYGESENAIGSIKKRNFNLITKLPRIPKNIQDIEEWINLSVYRSLKNLNCNQIYGLLLHYPNQLLEENGSKIYESLIKLKKNRIVNKIGISIYEPNQLDKILQQFYFDIVQSPLNIFDRRIINSGWLTKLKDRNIKLHIRSIFLQGLLIMNKSDRDLKFTKWKDLWSSWDEWILKNNISPVSACLNFALQTEYVDKVIIGFENQQQLKEIIGSITNKTINVPDWSHLVDDKLLNPSLWNKL